MSLVRTTAQQLVPHVSQARSRIASWRLRVNQRVVGSRLRELGTSLQTLEVADRALPHTRRALHAAGRPVPDPFMLVVDSAVTDPSGSTPISRDPVLQGTLSNASDGCYALWTKFTFDFVPGPVRQQATICGPGSVDIDVRQAYQPTTTGSVTICKGTTDTSSCTPWTNITRWPIDQT